MAGRFLACFPNNHRFITTLTVFNPNIKIGKNSRFKCWKLFVNYGRTD